MQRILSNLKELFGPFLVGGGDTCYWLEMRCFMFRRLLHITIYVSVWW